MRTKRRYLVTYYRTNDIRAQMEVFACDEDEADAICFDGDNKYMYSVSVQELPSDVRMQMEAYAASH